VALVMGPPDGEGVPQSMDVLVFPGAGGTLPAPAATATSAPVINTEMVALDLHGVWGQHPDFLWWPTGEGETDGPSNGGYLIETLEPAGRLGGSGDTLIERWQSSGIGHTLGKGSLEDLAAAQVVVFGYPEVAGLFKDTADGETGQPYMLSFLNAGPIDPAEGDVYEYPGLYWDGDDGASAEETGFYWFFDGGGFDSQDGEGQSGQYFFLLEVGDGPVVMGGLWNGNEGPPSTDSPPLVLFQWGTFDPQGDDPAAWNEFLNQMQWSHAVGWATVSGLKASVEIVEWQEGEPCPTPGMTGLPELPPLASATPEDESSGGGGGSGPTSAPTATERATLEPSRTPEPTREPPKPTATPRN
jgi:hypothetical protein